MAAFYGGLFLILSIGMTGSRSAPAIRSESPGSSSFWDQDPLNIGKRALALRKAGDLRAAEALYLEGYAASINEEQPLSAVRFLISAGACQFLAYHYNQALATFIQARELAESTGDTEDAGVIAFNLSSLHLQVWNLPAASEAAKNGIRALQQRFPQSAYLAPLLLQIGRLHSLSESTANHQLPNGEAKTYFLAGIEAARQQEARSMEALGWDLLGDQQMSELSLPSAERSLGQAFRIRVMAKLTGELAFSYARLGALKLTEGDLPAALRLTGRAINLRSATWPNHILLEQRARIRLAMGQIPGALEDFSAALDAAADWRLQVPLARSSLTATNIALERQIFAAFVEAAGSYAVDRKNPVWAAKAFEALEVNRSASLRQSIALAPVWREKLPPKYWELLGELTEKERAPRLSAKDSAKMRRLRLGITELEAQAGYGFAEKKDENFARRTSLIHFQAGLREAELFLSFFLGKRASYLWAVSRSEVRLFRLPAERDLAKDVQSFREALSWGGIGEGGAVGGGAGRDGAEAIRSGDRLYRELFGQLDLKEQSKTAWLLSLDGTLFDIPFAALVAEQQGGKTVYLIDRHSLQIVPGALALADHAPVIPSPAIPFMAERNVAHPAEPAWFLGVGDPVYNRADARWQTSPGLVGGAGETGLERLVGSAAEVEGSAQVWRQSANPVTILTGADAARSRFMALLAHPKTAGPGVIHLATHAFIPPDDREQGSIVFSLTPDRDPQFLTVPEIATLRVPGALVVMTGCATGTGDVQAGAGLLGLTRAWLMAGAGTVLATAWPVVDNSGEIMAQFYRNFQTTSAPEALRRMQSEMAHEGTWRSNPAYWASYQLTGVVH